ncbi:MAG: UDP-glucose/GDP-mannose dehydrogenase family protein [Planctomycetes bacterium]|nr:UDP-glucose/GDP-mannose dehydrogenase family protein [Planctomycetota bacterium]
MRVCVIGSGYVGLVTAACLADSGNHVVAVDKDERKVKLLSSGVCTIYEPGLEEMLKANLAADRLRFSTDIRQAVASARVVFVAVGTPPREDGSADLSNIDAVAREIGRAIVGLTVVVMKSTVPVGTCAHVSKLIAAETQQPFHVVSNPEFLKEGNAVDDFFRPDRVVIGTDDAEAGDIVAELYKPFVRNNKPILIMSRTASEMTKYAANCYLATRISFINEIATMCESLGVNVDEVRRGIGFDVRIGHHFLYPGLGYGGSCFPKDVLALAHTAKEAGVECGILNAVTRRNALQREGLVRQIRRRLGPRLDQRRIVVWGLAFKPKTDDVREAPAISVIEDLLKDGAKIAVHDPRALESAKAALGGRVSYHADAYEPLKGADALVACTEWMEYRSVDFKRIHDELKQPVIFDGRNIWDPELMRRYGFEYFSIGRPAVKPT